MVDSKNNPDNYKTLKISTGDMIKDSRMQRFVPDHVKTKKTCKNAAKKLPFVINYVPNRLRLKKCVIKLL